MQERSVATVEALVVACARILRTRGYGALTARSLTDEAGVGIGSLYDFFPGTDAVVATVVEREVQRLVGIATDLVARSAIELEPRGAIEALVSGLVEAVLRERALLRTLLREVPFLDELVAWSSALPALVALATSRSAALRDHLALPELEADVWLVSRMVHRAVEDLVFLESSVAERSLLTRELGRLVARMLVP